MVRTERAFKRSWSSALLRSPTTLPFLSSNADLPTPADPEPPQVNLPHVDTQLNMHQFTSFLDDSGATDDQSDSQTSPSHPPNPSASPNMNGAEAPTEWSAVGHAATGKSGRVIHNLQEEIARLTRECSLYRSRAEETQRSNEALKIQVQNINERLRNLEQVNETNLNSIARKDRKVDELRAELASERTKRQEAETNTSKTNETMREEREQHHREQARAQEIAKYHETQYEVFAGTTKREKADMGRRLKVLWNEVQLMAEAQKTQDVNTERLDVLADQKNREVEGLKETHEKLLASHVEYKRTKDNELRGTIERAHDNNAKIDLAMESLKKTEAEMKWAIQLAKNSTKD
ncbi:hypothetical protein N7492_001370 [Penicillium capsulatum]|uniref:SWI5-dependent HO expression protein 3 n=1 Tax=Penicillium capsulatum TaxID=69766 RepID=A0A9W9ITJ0_9EURO|nr:hypothetical protein N7492_001370 [Penicillium capsulatum]KAJ6129577.1 hypothetical protein N7512_002357 [Penicillium capsulatum]